MLRVFYGANRLEAEKNLKKILGEKYEVFEGENLTLNDLPSIFQGTSLFEVEKRRILLKDLSENTSVLEKVADYVDTPHEIIIWEQKLDKRSVGYKNLKAAGVELKEFTELKKPDFNLVFGILDTAFRDGNEAVRMLEKIESDQDPYMFFGLLVTQMLKKYDATRGSVRERRILKELAEIDLQMKSSTVAPWSLIKGFLLRVSSI